VNRTPIVRQYGILKNEWGVFMLKGVPNQRYTGEFKQRVVETMRQERLSCREAAQQFGIGSKSHVSRWERIYLEEGPEGLYVERRGRCSKGRPPKLEKKVEEDLIAENQRLRAENAYLKNLQALVLEDERHQRKRRR
jgi:transposase-like protein